MTTYICTTTSGFAFRMEADFSQASRNIRIDGESTPFQVADARHNVFQAAKLAGEWSYHEDGDLDIVSVEEVEDVEDEREDEISIEVAS